MFFPVQGIMTKQALAWKGMKAEKAGRSCNNIKLCLQSALLFASSVCVPGNVLIKTLVKNEGVEPLPRRKSTLQTCFQFSF